MSSAVRQGRRSAVSRALRRWTHPAAIKAWMVITLLAVGAVAWTHLQVRDALRRQAAQYLRAVLRGQVETLQCWISAQRDQALRLGADPQVQTLAQQLLRPQPVARSASKSQAEAEGQRELQSLISRAASSKGFVGWGLIDTDGNVIAANLKRLVGTALPLPPDTLERVMARQATACRPFRCPVPLTEQGPLSRSDGAVMGTITPITQGARPWGGLILLIDPKEEFFKLLSVAQTGRSGETYALDQQGILLTQSRFDDRLRRMGLLDNDPAVASPLNITIREPHADADGTPASLASRPLTYRADQATRGGQGENVKGYVGYRGTQVIGAWRWLPDAGIAVGTEVEVAEAYAPLIPLKRLFLALLTL
ncbi:MAG: cache domain-containing protein, partial [Pirellulales bacterium]|nr:cache domain-containing protein [Pirellulales bacterium]